MVPPQLANAPASMVVDGLVLDCPFKQSGQSDDEYAQICPAWKAANDAIRLLGNELFRSQIRAALKTW